MARKVVKDMPKTAPAPAPAPKARPKPPNAGKGRPKGVPNKVTTTAKEAIAMLADGMTGELQQWLRLASYGVARAYTDWEPPEGWEPEHGYPPGSKFLAKGKIILAPVLGENGTVATFSLADIMAGALPPGANIEWIVRPDPGGATDTMLRALEYHIPKLNRTEMTGRDGKDLVPAAIYINGVKPPTRERT